MMRVRFEASHVSGDFSSGRLEIDILREDAAGFTRHDDIFFAVPPDFHAHNDLVATALMTLVGRNFPLVSFNFPISEHCAATLRAHYNLDEVGPVDPALAPRQRGRFIGLSLSGGIDSIAAWVLLKNAGCDFKVITSDYGGPFERERLSFEHFPRDITCATDLRLKGFDRSGRFIFATPLLFADYLDLAGITSGHTFMHAPPRAFDSFDRGQEPPFRAQERSFTAGGVDEVHLIRGLTPFGAVKVAWRGVPERLEDAFAASSIPGTDKYFGKGLMVRWLCAQAGEPPPPFLEPLAPPKKGVTYGVRLAQDFRAPFFAKHYGLEMAELMSPGFTQHDLSFLDDLTLDFLWKFNTNFVSLIPEPIRGGVLDALYQLEVYPFDERDWRELRLVRDFLYATADRR